MEEIKFKQAIIRNGRFARWYYWGFLPMLGFRGAYTGRDWDNENYNLIAEKKSYQYTGKEDKNGVEIYSRDYLDVDRGNRIVEVVWLEPQACFDTKVVKIMDKISQVPFRALENSQWNYRCEVIGNVEETTIKEGK